MSCTCLTCIWRTTGFNDGSEPHYCAIEGDFVDPESCCDFWQQYPERVLVNNVNTMDREVEG